MEEGSRENCKSQRIRKFVEVVSPSNYQKLHPQNLKNRLPKYELNKDNINEYTQVNWKKPTSLNPTQRTIGN